MTDGDRPSAPATPSAGDEIPETAVAPEDLRHALARDPADAGARIDLADHLAEAGATADALDELRLAFAALRAEAAADVPAADRRLTRAMLALSEDLEAVGEETAAALQVARARRVHGPLADLALNEARRALAEGRAEAAREALERALALAPERPEAHRLAAEAAAAGAPLDHRVGHLAAAAGLAPADAAVRVALGRRLRALERPTAAAATLRAALRLDPEAFDAWRELAAILRDEGQFAAALPLARHLVALRGDDARAHVMLGTVLDGLGDIAAAAESLQRALTLDGDLHPTRRRLGAVLAELGRWEESLETWQDAALREPERAATLMQLGDALAALGRHADAVAWYRRAAERAPTSRTIAGRLADALLRREHWAAAEAPLAVARPLREAYGLPAWDGDRRVRVVLHHRTADGLDALLLGLGLAAQAGSDAVCVVPRAAVAVARRALPGADILVREDTADVAAAAAERGATAQARFRDLPRVLRGARGASVLPAWLAEAAPPARRWAVVTPAAGVEAPPPALWEALADALGPDTVVVSGDASPDRLAEALADVAAVVTADGPAAHVAGAMGLHGILVLPPQAPWWWGDRGAASVWYPRLRLIRAARPGAWDGAMRHVGDQVAARSDAADTAPPPRPDRPDQDLAEALDRLAPHLGRARAPIVCTPLDGRRRPRLYRVEAPVGPIQLRLGRFPPRDPAGHHAEIHNMRLAAEAGLAPPVVHGDGLDGLLATTVIEAQAVTARDLRDRDTAVAAADLYRRLHGLSGFRGRVDPFVRIDRLVAILERDGNELVRTRASVRRAMRDIRGVLRGNQVRPVCCHGVPTAGSFRLLPGDGTRLMLPDWQGSGLADPHWEVATLCAQADMPAAVRDAYLAAYLGDGERPEACRLPLFEAVACWWRWLRAVEGLQESPEDADLAAEEERWWERLRRRLDAEGFATTLEAARAYRAPAAGR